MWNVISKMFQDNPYEKARPWIYDPERAFFLWFYLFAEAIFRPIKTPMAEAIIKPRVQPLESPRQCRPFMFVLKSMSILTRLL